MAKEPKVKSGHKVLIGVGVAAIVVVGYEYLKRKKAAANAAATPSTGTALNSNNAVVNAQTLTPNLQVLNPNGSNGQGNYGMDSNSSYARALQNEANLSAQLQTLQSTASAA